MNAGNQGVHRSKWYESGPVSSGCRPRLFTLHGRSQAGMIHTDFSLHSLKSPPCAPERACTTGSHRLRAGIVMLQTTTWIPGAGKCRPEGNALAHSAAFQRLAPPTPPDHSHGMDRKKRSNSPCNGAWQPSIIVHRLTCEVSFPDAELAQCTNKGGAPCFGRGRRQDSVSNIAKESPVSHFIHSRFIPRKEVRSGPIRSNFPGRRPNVGGSLFN